MSDERYPLRMHDFSLHDPFVLADQSTGLYYLYNANYFQYPQAEHGFGKSVVMYVSPDLVHFSEPRNVFDLTGLPEGAWYDDSDSPWAPEVHEWQGRYWMLVTVHARRGDPARPSEGPDWYRSEASLTSRRAVVAAVSDRPDGPFVVTDPTRPITPIDDMTLDGTLVVDRDGAPWMVYAHEWVQLFDGTMEAIRLDPQDLSRAVGEPTLLWRATEGVWHDVDGDVLPWSEVERGASGFVTDGPYVVRTPNGSLVSLWTSYSRGEYVLAQAISRSGEVAGPWEQLPVLDHRDAGHAMLVRSFEGPLLLVMHTNMTRKDASGADLTSHGIVYEAEVTDNGIVMGRHRADLDGIVDPDHDV